MNFSNIQVLWTETYTNKIDKAEQMVWSQFPIKIPKVYFVDFVLDKNSGGKTNEKLTKKTYLEQSATPFEKKTIIVTQTFSSKLWSNKHYS